MYCEWPLSLCKLLCCRSVECRCEWPLSVRYVSYCCRSDGCRCEWPLSLCNLLCCCRSVECRCEWPLSCAVCCAVIGVTDVVVNGPWVCATCCAVAGVLNVGVNGPWVCTTCCAVAGVIDHSPNSPYAQFAEQLARRAALDRRCDEVSLSLCLFVSVCIAAYLSVYIIACFSQGRSHNVVWTVAKFGWETSDGQFWFPQKEPKHLRPDTFL